MYDTRFVCDVVFRKHIFFILLLLLLLLWCFGGISVYMCITNPENHACYTFKSEYKIFRTQHELYST